MTTTMLYDEGGHKNVLLDEGEVGGIAVQANQHVIIHNGEGMILDPGGHKVYNKVLSATFSVLAGGKLKYLVLSHQDPDIVAAVNGWLMTTDAEAYASNLWLRFIPHFGLDRLVSERLHGVPDGGMTLNLGGVDIQLLPGHFLHSTGNFQVYDPISKILYTGDLGASLGNDYQFVTDFDDHLQYIEGFHKRYMASGKAMSLWANMARKLDIETIAPQHGSAYRGKELVNKFIDWADGFKCGIDYMDDVYNNAV